MDILGITGNVLFTSALTGLKDVLVDAVKRGANLYGADLYGAELYGADLCDANLRGADLRSANGESKKIHSIQSFSASLYPYVVLAVLFEDGEKMIKMGCLEKTLEQWKKVGIRKSNLIEFPDNGSEVSETRVGLFNLARTAVTRMGLTN